MIKCVIARHINGITLNDYQFLLDRDNQLYVFPSIQAAIYFLSNNGVSAEYINDYRFFDYEKLKDGIYEEVN